MPYGTAGKTGKRKNVMQVKARTDVIRRALGLGIRNAPSDLGVEMAKIIASLEEGGTKMNQHPGYLTPEERARITEIQDLRLERFVAHKDAIANNLKGRAKELEKEIEDLQYEKENVRKWAAVGSA